MAEQTNIVREGIDRVSSAFERIPDEVQKMQRELQKRRKTFERQLAGGRRDLGKDPKDVPVLLLQRDRLAEPRIEGGHEVGERIHQDVVNVHADPHRPPPQTLLGQISR